jgi:hypothetical protein
MVTIHAEWKHPKTGVRYPPDTRFIPLPEPGSKWHWKTPDGKQGVIRLDGIPGD